MLSLEHDEEHWTNEYRTWLDRRDRESSSGVGSTRAATRHVRRALEFILTESRLTKNIRSVLDLPCGDWNWMRLVDLSGVRYTGADIVRPLIVRNERLFGGENKRFIVFDVMIDDALPDCYDLVFCRDLIGHFRPLEGLDVIRKIADRGSSYLMTTTFPHRSHNHQTVRSWYPCNLQKSPFGFPEPLFLFCEHSAGDKSLGVWSCRDIAATLA